jgi:hypothetical protein
LRKTTHGSLYSPGTITQRNHIIQSGYGLSLTSVEIGISHLHNSLGGSRWPLTPGCALKEAIHCINLQPDDYWGSSVMAPEIRSKGGMLPGCREGVSPQGRTLVKGDRRRTMTDYPSLAYFCMSNRGWSRRIYRFLWGKCAHSAELKLFE